MHLGDGVLQLPGGVASLGEKQASGQVAKRDTKKTTADLKKKLNQQLRNITFKELPARHNELQKPRLEKNIIREVIFSMTFFSFYFSNFFKLSF